jgi:hypothetical protein
LVEEGAAETISDKGAPNKPATRNAALVSVTAKRAAGKKGAASCRKEPASEVRQSLVANEKTT